MDKNKSFFKFQVFNFIVVAILGVLLHFIFEWSNQNPIIGAISATNESTWEHLKLLFFPMLLMTIIGYFYFKNSFPNFICAQTLGILSSLIFIVTFFYLYTGILGFNIDIINILSFFIAVILEIYISSKTISIDFPCKKNVAITSLIVLTFMFILFTYFPPKIGLFKDPITSKYGIMQKSTK